MIIERAQIEKIAKYIIGIPKMASLRLNIRRKGILRMKNNPNESTTNF